MPLAERHFRCGLAQQQRTDAFNYPIVTRDVRRSSERRQRKNPLEKRAYPKRLMGLEPTTFCMASWLLQVVKKDAGAPPLRVPRDGYIAASGPGEVPDRTHRGDPAEALRPPGDRNELTSACTET
jgi:hypothetical protein